MMTDLHDVRPGQPLGPRSAAQQNALLATARAADMGTAPPRHQTGGRNFPYQQNTQIWVRNDSNFEFDRYAVVGLDEAIWPPDGNALATESFFNEPVLSVRPPEACRHWGRWAVLTQPLVPGEVGRAVMSAGAVAFVGRKIYDEDGEVIAQADLWPAQNPSAAVNVDVELEADGVEYHTTTYGRRRRDGLWQHANGSAQVLWAGRDATHYSHAATCGGSVDVECDAFGSGWVITRDSCVEGCSAWAEIDAFTVPCTPGAEHLDLECLGVTGDADIPHRFGGNPPEIATIRIGNSRSNTPADAGCGCNAKACRSECQEVAPDDWQWVVVMNACHPTAAPTTSTSADPSTTTTTADPLATTTTTAAPECACPDLNTLAATWPELYPCGPTEAVKAQTHFCYTTTTSTSTSSTSTSTSSTSTSTSSTSTSTSTTTVEPTTTVPPSTTTTTQEPCSGECAWCSVFMPGSPGYWMWGNDGDHPSTCLGDGCNCNHYVACPGDGASLCHDEGGVILGPDDGSHRCGDEVDPNDNPIYLPCLRDEDPPPPPPSTPVPTTTSTSTSTEAPTTTGSPTSTTSGGPSSTTSEEPTSTSEPTTTASPTSTTTTAEPECDGNCHYTGVAAAECPSGFVWNYVGNACAGEPTCGCYFSQNSGCGLQDDCTSSEAAAAPTYAGQNLYVSCNNCP